MPNPRVPGETLRCHVISLGCPKNRVDTEESLGRLGVRLVPVDSPEAADFVLINTCAFIQPAVEESVRQIAQVIADCADEDERPLIAVAGCLVGRYGAESMAPDLPEVDLWLDNRELERWPEQVRQALGLRRAGPATGRWLSTGPSYAWLKIGEGCNHTCSFCTIPAIRGRYRSFPAAAIEEEARLLLGQGVRELVLVAQDVSAWGTDLDDAHGLPTLLDRLLPLPGLDWLRLLYLYPAGISEDLLKYLGEAGKPLLPYFDVPLQHASPTVLSRMGRPFARDPRRVIDRIRHFFPEAALRTSLISGFPGESESDHQALLRFVEETRFHHLGVFTYQAEEGTPAAAMPDQVERSVSEARREEIMELQAGISAEILSAHINERLPVLVDAPHTDWPGLHMGRVWFQAPEIDGITYISGPGVQPGALVEADITESQRYDLVALESF